VVLPILTSLKQLTTLALNTVIEQSEFDALLTHAPLLTSFTCSQLYLSEDRSASPCSWKELVMELQGLDTETLTYIPTASLTGLAFNNVVFPSPSPTLVFAPCGMFDPAITPDSGQRSLVNLMRCPAWQQGGPAVHVRLVGKRIHGMPELGSLVPALARLAGKEVELFIDMPDAAVGPPEVQQLGATLGSSLKQLVLEKCEASDDFWPSIWDHLPGLQLLEVRDRVRGGLVSMRLHSSAAVPHAPCSSAWGGTCTRGWRAGLTRRAGGWVCLRSLSLQSSSEPHAEMQPGALPASEPAHTPGGIDAPLTAILSWLSSADHQHCAVNPLPAGHAGQQARHSSVLCYHHINTSWAGSVHQLLLGPHDQHSSSRSPSTRHLHEYWDFTTTCRPCRPSGS
jgi:hypothetical protein